MLKAICFIFFFGIAFALIKLELRSAIRSYGEKLLHSHMVCSDMDSWYLYCIITYKYPNAMCYYYLSS